MPGLHSSSAGPIASCRTGWPTLCEIPGLDPEPESPAASGGHTPSEGAALLGASHRVILNLIRTKRSSSFVIKITDY